ncbi:hypothetical protein ElyMa_005363500 [Elysia marginata]|uniref:Uncharacterized protein n=1 Tax=Elysia marginata TaxID=1093978 RepID=A0AAV4EDX9_9GAST|nr:hypothetical protein ElyMa_005363500 [Elysia marginata]
MLGRRSLKKGVVFCMEESIALSIKGGVMLCMNGEVLSIKEGVVVSKEKGIALSIKGGVVLCMYGEVLSIKEGVVFSKEKGIRFSHYRNEIGDLCFPRKLLASSGQAAPVDIPKKIYSCL